MLVQARVQKSRLGGQFFPPSYRKFDLKMKVLDFCTTFVSFLHFSFSCNQEVFLGNRIYNLKVNESKSSKT